ncbi:flagellar biosynthesis protein FlhF [Stieleria mannarensis]|uniref:flagellar biosynthesis protein FlhF n=1 Tax=Stieleria mannarensis TaxID=2755585 RepID=UPI001600F177|nr:flagellar biosynthesis protein FlhF [Rhodopirellula sp. JC639]
MQVKIFRAANLQAALEEIREQLGPHASVLRTRQCRDGWMGWLGRSYVEVTASTGDQQRDAGGLPTDDSHRFPSRVPGMTHPPGTPPIDSRQTLSVVPRLAEDDRQVAAATSRITPSGIHPRSIADPTSQYRTGLLSLGVSETVADRWIRSTSGFVANLDERWDHSWLEQLQRSVAREIRLSGPIRLSPGERRIVALIGPTGVGKTTTVAKLAAGFRIQSKRRVGLLTIDTFRIAAVQQLQAYAQIMDLPMSVVESSDQMRGAIDQLGDVDLILIDTAGRSPKGDMNIAGLAELLRTAQPDETHLVISATSTAAVVQSALDGFAAARPTAAILSKLDETPYTAGVLSALTASREHIGLPISYVTNGQHVPDDIAVATAETLVERLVPAPVGVRQIEAA